jgi:putative ABC transport system substrate-binding protein
MSFWTRRRFVLGSGALCIPAPMVAQPAVRTARVGWIDISYDNRSVPRDNPLAGFRAGLRGHGWMEGRNLELQLRVGPREAVVASTIAMVRDRVDVIVAGGPVFQTVRTHAGSTPIVFTMSGDPVEAKWVTTLARPGGNATGLTSMALELESKRLDLLREIAPRIKRVAVLGNVMHPGYGAQLEASAAAARQLGLTLLPEPLKTAADLAPAFDSILRNGGDAIHTFQDGLIHQQAKVIADFATRNRLPSVGGWLLFVEAGGLLSYGPNEQDFYHRVADYVDRILRGTKPSEIPVERPTRFELMVSRTTAAALGIKLPPEILLRAAQIVS